MSVEVASVNQSRPVKKQKTSKAHGNFRGRIKFKNFSIEEYNPTFAAQRQQLYELWHKAGLVMGKTQGKSKK